MIGGLVSILVLVPSLLWMVFPPLDPPQDESGPSKLPHKLLQVMEWLGRIAGDREAAGWGLNQRLGHRWV